MLLDDDRQVHARVESTVEMIGSRHGEWSNHLLVVPSELYIDHWCISLLHRLGDGVVPGAIGNLMRYRNIIDQRNTASFAYRNR